MPGKKTVYATDEERHAAEAKKQEKRDNEVKQANAYPLKYLRGLGIPGTLSTFVKENDRRPFFVAPRKRRTCVVAADQMLPLVPESDGFDRSSVHENSFKLDTSSLDHDTIDKLGGDNLKILDDLSRKNELEMDSNTNRPEMRKVEGYTRRLPVMNSTPNFYRPAETILRYMPSLVAGDKELAMSDTHTLPITEDANGPKTSILRAILSPLLYGITVSQLSNLPETGSQEARELWESNVRRKLFIVAADKCNMHETSDLPKNPDSGDYVDFGVFYTISMPDVAHTVDHLFCQGSRKLELANLRMITEWIALTTELVGAGAVPKAAEHYKDALVAKNSRISNFDTIVLAEKAEEMCKNMWPSLKEREVLDTDDKGVLYWKMTTDLVNEYIEKWADKPYCNPSIPIMDAEGNRSWELMFNSDEDERAMLGEMFTCADFRDGAMYTAAEFKNNETRMASVFKTLAYVNADKDPPLALTVHDSEQALASKKRGRKRKAAETSGESSGSSAPQAAMSAEDSVALGKVLENTDALMVELANVRKELADEVKRAKKLRLYVYKNLPPLPEEEDGDATD